VTHGLTKSYYTDAPPEAVWRALTDPSVIDAWGGGPAEIRAEPGAAFTFWGGDIFGTVTAAEPPNRPVQEWWGDEVEWDEASVATFELRSEREGTRLTLAHTNVPDNEADEFDAGWDDYYLGPLKELLER
jgi:uncharacterized protein YndB with AHSA1/START domain